MKIYEKKKVFICAQKPQNKFADIYVDIHIFNRVRRFPYLCNMITLDGKDTREIK